MSAPTASAQPAGLGFFPLDEELGLLPGALTPRLTEALVRLSTWIPSFAQAARELAYFTGSTVSTSTAVRRTHAAGQAALAVQRTDVDALERDAPPPPAGPEQVVLSVDGAMVPLVHGVWTEVKTLAVGAVRPTVAPDGTPTVQTTDLSYFSRATDSTTFSRLAFGEVQRRGVATAGRLGAVVDGAEWIQGFLALHAPTAVHILDFPHAAGYVAAIGQTQVAGQRVLSEEQVMAYLHRLKHAGPREVLAELQRVVEAHADVPELGKKLSYLASREAQLQYPTFAAAGWPLGSGMVESANKLVVEARLKGAGMHWAPAHVDPMLVLRNAVCNDRWDEVWGQIEGEVRRGVGARRSVRQQRRAVPARPQPSQRAQKAPAASPDEELRLSRRAAVIAQVRAEMQQPARGHPWRHPWSRRQQARQTIAA